MATRHHIFIAGDTDNAIRVAKEAALTAHYPGYAADTECRTRITVLLADLSEVRDICFEFQELLDNSYRRIVDLSSGAPKVRLFRPQYEGVRKDFVDVEWEFVIGHISHPLLQAKLAKWAGDPGQRLDIRLCYGDMPKNSRYADKLSRRLPLAESIRICRHDPAEDASKMEELLGMAKYLNYFYKASYEQEHVPTELPEEEVEKAWAALDDTQRMSNICNVMSIPVKMEILGHDRDDWDTFYALTAAEIDSLTEVEHNRWVVERLIQGCRPCTGKERREIEEDLASRLADPGYAADNPVSLKKRYKTERNAHFDICAFSDLGVDETGLSVVRYDRDLTAAIPLIVKTYNDRRPHNG